MRDEPVDLLERELLRAARRARVSAAAGPPRPRRRAGWEGLALAGSVLVVVLVAAVALVGLHGHGGARRLGPVAPAGQDGRLRAVLGVLRRPQTAADRRALRRSHELQTPLATVVGGRLDRASARLATITPWHARVLVAVVDPVRHRGRGQPAPLAQPSLLLFTGEGGACCATAATVLATGDAQYENDGGPPAVARLYAVVPDGVARVTFHVAAGKSHPTHAITSAVHSNVAVVQTRGSCCAGWSPLMTWYAADGHVIKRAVNVSPPGSVIPARRVRRRAVAHAR
jgi:hypothetical protein